MLLEVMNKKADTLLYQCLAKLWVQNQTRLFLVGLLIQVEKRVWVVSLNLELNRLGLFSEFGINLRPGELR